MYKMMVLYNEPADPEHFHTYYVDKHLPLAAKLPGLITQRYSFAVDGPGGESAVFAIWEGEFADARSASQAMQSDIGKQVLADTRNYADGGLQLCQYEPVEVGGIR